MQDNKKEDPVANLEAERQLLGRLLLENADFWKIGSFLKPEHFYLPVHEQIFEQIQALVMRNETADPITLIPLFTNEIRHQPPVRYFMALVNDATTSMNVEPYARSIFNLAMRRQIISGGLALIEKARISAVETPIDAVLQSADLLFSDIRLKSALDPSDTTSIEAVCETSYRQLLELIGSPASTYPTIGLKRVTRLMGPLTPGCVYVIAGRPGSGKTAAAVAASRSIIRQTNPEGQNFGVSFFTLEVTKRDIWNRFVACEMAQTQTPMYYMNLKRGHVTSVQLQAVEHFSNALKRFPLTIDDKSGLTVAEIFIRARAEKQRLAKQGIPLAVVVVDYLQIIRPSGVYQGNKVAEISEISTALVQLAKDLNVAVIAVSQLSRKVEERNDKRPIMADLRESGQIEQDANSIIFLFRPAYYDNQLTEYASSDELEMFQQRENDLHYIVGKARDGIPGEVVVKTDIGKNHIYE